MGIRKIFFYLKAPTHLLPIIHNGAWLVFERGARLIFGLLVGAWVARYLGPSQFGELAYILAFISIFQGITSLGLDGIVVREISQQKSLASLTLGTTFISRTYMGIFCWMMAIIIAGFSNGFASTTTILTALIGASLCFQSAETVDLWFQSQSQSKRTVLVKFLAYCVSNAVKIILILGNAPLIAFAAIITFEALLVACGLYFAYQRYPCGGAWYASLKKSQLLLVESWPYILSSLSIALYMRIDHIMIKQYLGDEQLGIYSAALPLATFWQFIPMTIAVSLGPLVAKTKLDDEAKYLALLSRIFRFFSLMGWGVFIFIVLFSGYLVPLLYGSQYEQSIQVLNIYALTNIAINMGIAQTLWLVNERKSIISSHKTISGAIFCIIGNLIFLPIFGIVGAAVVALMSMVISAIISNAILDKKIFILQIRSIFFIPQFFTLRNS